MSFYTEMRFFFRFKIKIQINSLNFDLKRCNQFIANGQNSGCTVSIRQRRCCYCSSHSALANERNSLRHIECVLCLFMLIPLVLFAQTKQHEYLNVFKHGNQNLIIIQIRMTRSNGRRSCTLDK